MKHNISKRLIASALVIMMLLSGCAASSKYESSAGAAAPQAPSMMENGFASDYKGEISTDSALTETTVEPAETEEEIAESTEATDTTDPLAGKNIKLIWRAEMSMETLDFDTMVESMNKCVAEFGGYIESSYVEGGERLAGYKNNRYGDYTIRIPASNLDAFLNQMGGIGNVISRSKHSENITLEYADTEARKATLELEEKKLMELLEKATILEDIITLESRLSDVHYRLDGYASALRKYDDLVDFSTVNLSIHEVKRMQEAAPETLGQRIGNEFKDSLYSVSEFAEDFVVFIIGGSPLILLWIVIIIVLVVCVRFVLKLRSKINLKPRKSKKENYSPAPYAENPSSKDEENKK